MLFTSKSLKTRFLVGLYALAVSLLLGGIFHVMFSMNAHGSVSTLSQLLVLFASPPAFVAAFCFLPRYLNFSKTGSLPRAFLGSVVTVFAAVLLQYIYLFMLFFIQDYFDRSNAFIKSNFITSINSGLAGIKIYMFGPGMGVYIGLMIASFILGAIATVLLQWLFNEKIQKSRAE